MADIPILFDEETQDYETIDCFPKLISKSNQH